MSPTQARFSFGFVPARTRLLLNLIWLALMVLTALFWLGGAGAAMTLLLATRWLRRMFERLDQREIVTLRAESLEQVWALPAAICIESGQVRLWVFADEVEAPVWAALRRFLKQALPRQALGLSISR